MMNETAAPIILTVVDGLPLLLAFSSTWYDYNEKIEYPQAIKITNVSAVVPILLMNLVLVVTCKFSQKTSVGSAASSTINCLPL
jgi:hypothetical protein